MSEQSWLSAAADVAEAHNREMAKRVLVAQAEAAVRAARTGQAFVDSTAWTGVWDEESVSMSGGSKEWDAFVAALDAFAQLDERERAREATANGKDGGG